MIVDNVVESNLCFPDSKVIEWQPPPKAWMAWKECKRGAFDGESVGTYVVDVCGEIRDESGRVWRVDAEGVLYECELSMDGRLVV